MEYTEELREVNRLTSDILMKLYQMDRSGRLLYLFVKKLSAKSRLKGYGIDDKYTPFVVSKDEYKKINSDLSGENMKDVFKAFDYACYKFYYVICNRYGVEQRVEGLLLNYNGGDIVLLSENGICHLKCKDILFMKPFAPPMDRLGEEFKRLLNYYMDN